MTNLVPYKTVKIPPQQLFDLKIEIADFAFNAFYFESGNSENPYVETSEGDLTHTPAAHSRFYAWFEHAENILVNHGIDCDYDAESLSPAQIALSKLELLRKGFEGAAHES